MNNKALIMGAVTILIWSSSFAGIRASILGGYDPAPLVLMRFLVASGVFLLYFLLPGNKFPRPKKEDLPRIMLLGFIGITVYHTGLTLGMESVTAGTASMIVGAAPFFTAIIAVFFLKERMSLFSWIGLGIGFVGIILITLGTSGASIGISHGVLFILVATISTSFFFVFQKTLNTRYDAIELTAYFTWAGTLPLFFFFPDLIDSLQTASTAAHISAIYVGIFPAAIAYSLWGLALSLADASKVTSMMYVEPAIAIIIAWIWLQEWPSTLSIIGGGIALSSIFVVNMAGKKQRMQTNN
ncbi:DMT family transporter [Bacillus piscicola]|uniref:DMT family transporter n=1 Tax=Bacillus piscicola TaxID=1632684 RepID=UPI001F08A087|nr:DMT family transporter [Bacillus piscicola]